MKSKIVLHFNNVEIEINEMIQIIIAMVSLILASFVFLDGDCVTYTQWSMNIWDAIA